jgi:glycosyltransferase involved in cell wall biosynthesis
MTPEERRLLFVDMAYTVEIVRAKKHDQFFEMRHSDGYFGRVWAVHPLSDAAGKASREIETIEYSPRQTVIEGVAQAYRLPRWLLPLNFLLSQARLLRMVARLVRKEHISLIVATDAFYAGLFSLILKWMTGRPQVVTVLSNQDELYAATGALAMPRLLPSRFLEKALARFVLSRADLVIGGNNNNLAFAIANGARGETAVIPVAKNIEPAHLADPATRPGPEAILARHGIPAGAPMMLFVGRLLALKHPDDAVRAMAVAIEQVPEAFGLIAGSGPMQEELEALARSLGMEGRIRFLGHIDQQQLARIIPHCITLSPLTGMALIECGLGGSPAVAYDRDWQAEFVEDGVAGFVVPFRDHRAMADRAVRLLKDEGLRRRFSQAMRERALDFADRDRIYAREHALYDRLLAR